MRPAKRRTGVEDLWTRVVGEELAAETRAIAIRRGELIVEARSAALVHELQGFRREALLERLIAADTVPAGSSKASRAARVTGLRFRLGVF